MILALRADAHFRRIPLANQERWVAIQELLRELRGLVKRFRLRLAMIAPRSIELEGLAQAGQALKRMRVLQVYRSASSKTARHQGRRSRNNVLERDHRKGPHGSVQRLSPLQRRAELPEHINAQRLFRIDQLKQRLASAPPRKPQAESFCSDRDTRSASTVLKNSVNITQLSQTGPAPCALPLAPCAAHPAPSTRHGTKHVAPSTQHVRAPGSHPTS